MNKLEYIIKTIRALKEEGPTMSVGTGGFTASAPAAGPRAGYDKPMDFRTRVGRRVKQQPIARIEAKKTNVQQ